MGNGKWKIGNERKGIEYLRMSKHSIIQPFSHSLELGLLFIAVFFLSINAQPDGSDIPAVSNGNIKFYVDHSAFAGKDDKIYEEFYLMVYADQLFQISNENKKLNVFNVDAEIKDNSGNLVSEKKWTTEASIRKDSISFNDLAIIDQWGEELSPGSYYVTVMISDSNSSKEDKAIFDLSVNEPNNKSFSSSQIEFVSRFNNDISNKEFVKGNHSIFPNPSRRYGILNPLLYVYYELYNIPDTGKGELKITYSISNSDKKVVKALPSMEIKKTSANTSLLHGINVAALPSGVYNFRTVVVDSLSNQRISFSRQFEVIQLDYLKNKSALSYADAETASHYLKYITTPQQYNLYESLNLSGKAQYLINFWKDKDPSPGSSKNEYLENIQKRYAYVNEHFGWGKTEGWNTDRGRIFIKYGVPDEINRHYSEPNVHPYEIWYYHQKKNYEFDFGDLTDDGRFSLLNSTKEDETQNSNWKELISK